MRDETGKRGSVAHFTRLEALERASLTAELKEEVGEMKPELVKRVFD